MCTHDVFRHSVECGSFSFFHLLLLRAQLTVSVVTRLKQKKIVKCKNALWGGVCTHTARVASKTQAITWPVQTAVLIKTEAYLFRQTHERQMTEKCGWNAFCVGAVRCCEESPGPAVKNYKMLNMSFSIYMQNVSFSVKWSPISWDLYKHSTKCKIRAHTRVWPAKRNPGAAQTEEVGAGWMLY